jgi:uncharacterized protein YndB with AHSA1/START domain
MTDTTPATLGTTGGRPTLRFDRVLPCSVERLWRAVSRPDELDRWFPATTAWTPRAGEHLTEYGMTGEITAVDAPHLLTWVFDGDGYSLRVEETGDRARSRLEFTHTFDDRDLAAQTAAGWEASFRRLSAYLSAGFLAESEAHAGWGDDHERYAALFGVDPEPGRAFWRQFRDQG